MKDQAGGALAIGVADRILMLENAVYSILSPEGYASILWKDSSRAKEAAEIMKMTATDLYDMKIIDKIINEETDGAYDNIGVISNRIKDEFLNCMEVLEKLDTNTLVNLRYEKFRNMGEYIGG